MNYEEQLTDLIIREFPDFGTKRPQPDAPLLDKEGGPLDSLGVQLLMAGVEDHFDIEMLDEDISIETFRNIRSLAAVVQLRCPETNMSPS